MLANAYENVASFIAKYVPKCDRDVEKRHRLRLMKIGCGKPGKRKITVDVCIHFRKCFVLPPFASSSLVKQKHRNILRSFILLLYRKEEKAVQ